MRLSVVTPAYNAAAFIERTIQSVLAQTGDFDLEYLIMDGGSSDGTLDIVRRYEGRLRYVSEPDAGQVDAINKGLRCARGDVLAWLNADDLYHPGALQAVVGALRRTGARWCFGECAIIDGAGRPIRGAISRYKAWVSRRYTRRRLLGRNFIPQPAVFFHRELFQRAGPLDGSLVYAMDYDLWLRFSTLAEPAFVPATLASFRWHDRSTTATGYAAGVWECFGVAQRSARGAERLALGEHLLHALAELAVYEVLDALPGGRRPGLLGALARKPR